MRIGNTTFPDECPETKRNQPRELFTCQRQIFASVMNQKLINPVGAVYIYSDLRYCIAIG